MLGPFVDKIWCLRRQDQLVPANVDIDTQETIEMASEIDPEGGRTLQAPCFKSDSFEDLKGPGWASRGQDAQGD